MPRRKRQYKTQRSAHWLRVAVNEYPEKLNSLLSNQFGWKSNDQIVWLSPVQSDDYAEYYDQAFIDRLGLGICLVASLVEYSLNQRGSNGLLKIRVIV